MADITFTNIPQDVSYDYTNSTSDYNNYIYSNITDDIFESDGKFLPFIMEVVTCIVVAIGLSLILMAIYALFSLIRNDHVAPIYVINLLISDLIQFCGLAVLVALPNNAIAIYFHHSGVLASVCFMVCVALERYLVVACPLWYRFRRNIKISVGVCVVVWVFSFIMFYLVLYHIDYELSLTILGFIFLLPLPLFIFFLGGTLRALSASRIPSDEKRRVVGILVLVLLIYTLLFMPNVIWQLGWRYIHSMIFQRVTFMLVVLSPLADLFLYVFMRKGIVDKLLASVCCCSIDSSDNTTMDSTDISRVDSSCVSNQAV